MPNAIVAPQPLAVEEGAKVLMNGGNAIDAAITAAFVQAILSPQMCGIGGYALLTLHSADEAGPLGLDAPALAGSKVTPGMWKDRLIGPNPDGWGYFLEGKVNDAGYTSICIPGWVKGISAMLEKWGSISWSEAVEPAARIAEAGFVVTERLANRWMRKAPYPQACSGLDYIIMNAEARRIYLKADGAPYAMGDILHNPDYARTLRHLATSGPEDFYRGELARQMTSDWNQNGGFVTSQDLESYSLRDDILLTGSYRGQTIASSGPPHGGATLIAILNILENYDLSGMHHNSPDYIYLVAMAMKAAFADRNRHMADPYFNDVPVEWMIDKDRAAFWYDHIESGKPIDVTFDVTEPPHTTHVTVVDAHGNCVALTHSLGASSGVITPGLGFMYNNSMINFHPLPGHPNSIEPRKGRTTGMSPTIVYRDEKPLLVLGSPGATRIITSNVQVILNVLDFGMHIEEAVHAPRFDCQAGPIRCHMRIPEYVCEPIRTKHPIVRIPQSHGGFALVHAITIDPDSGALTGAADTGADGMALVV